ncbi:MAG: 2-deoxyribose-5-phosphate aldolase, partial [Micrococcales bacterium]|nr:2-deoxyribose-5-phosphate aldolase [Micrococcales bacterium]
MTALTRSEVARLVDHTLLKPESTPQQVAALAAEAAEQGA